MPFVSDTFTDTNGKALGSHTGEIGATWAHAPGYSAVATIQGNRLAPPSLTGTAYYASGVPATAEYDVECDLYYNSSTSDTSSGICGRMSTSVATLYMARYSTNPGVWQFYKQVSGTFTELGTYSAAFSVGQTRTIKMEIRDAAKKIYIDGVERISSADNAVTAAGRAGMRMLNLNLHYDNFTASDVVVASDYVPQPGVYFF